MARGAGLGITLEWSRVPLLAGVEAMAGDGFVTGASDRNWAGYGSDITLARGSLPPTAQALLTDPQTSGGLLVACESGAVEDVLAVFRRDGFDAASVIGRVEEGRGLNVVA